MTRVASRGLLLRRRIVLGGALLILAFTASAIVGRLALDGYAVVATDRELGNLSKALADEAGSRLQAVNVVMSEVAKWHEANDGKVTSEEGRAALAGLSKPCTPASKALASPMRKDRSSTSRSRSLPRVCRPHGWIDRSRPPPHAGDVARHRARRPPRRGG